MVDTNIICIDGKVLMGIQDINKLIQYHKEHCACACKESQGRGCKCKKAEVFDLKVKTLDERKTILDN